MRLEGHKVTGVTITETTLTFHTHEGDAVYEAEGDCCSHSYFHSFDGLGMLLSADAVVSLETLRLPPVPDDDPDAKRGDYVSAYGYAIRALPGPKVVATFSFRNDSNGYYGGYLRADGEYLYP